MMVFWSIFLESVIENLNECYAKQKQFGIRQMEKEAFC